MLNLDIMSRRLMHFGPVILAVWVLIFSVVAPLGLVVCIGDNGHMALEREHESGYHHPSPEIPANIGKSECGDCSDTPVILFYGRVRTVPKQSASKTYVINAPAAVFESPGPQLIHTYPKIRISRQYFINYPENLSSVVMLC